MVIALMLPTAAKAITVKAISPNWDSTVIAANGGVNLRQSASATSPQLMLDYPDEDGGGDALGDFAWSTAKKSRGYTRYPARLEQNPCPVMTQGDGWYQIYFADGFYPWVKGEFCKTLSIPPVKTTGNMAVYDYMNAVFQISSGKYAGLAMSFYQNEMSECAMYIGLPVNGKFVMSLQINGVVMEDGSVKTMKVVNDNGWLQVLYPASMDFSLETDEAFIKTLDFRKLNDSQIEQLLKVATPLPEGEEFIIYNNGQGRNVGMKFNPQGYKMTVTTETKTF